MNVFFKKGSQDRQFVYTLKVASMVELIEDFLETRMVLVRVCKSLG